MTTVRPTLADIADRAGVSIPTVSKVLNGRTDVAGTTRERVVQVMHALGYPQRIPVAPTGRGGVIDLLIGGVGTLWSLEIIRGAESATGRSGRSLVVASASNEHFTVAGWLETLVTHRSEGAIVVTARTTEQDFERLADLHIPVVEIDPGRSGTDRFAQVGATNWAGGLDATQHLIDLGHRRIGFIGGPRDLPISEDRLEGYSSALRRSGVDVDIDLIRHGDFMTASGEGSAASLLGLADPPTAIFASSDLEAMGAYQAAAARGLTIPDDLSVVGFDDTILCQYLSPQLTTIRQPLAEMADQAVRLLRDLGATQHPAHPRIELSTTLVVRGSTGPPRPSRTR